MTTLVRLIVWAGRNSALAGDWILNELLEQGIAVESGAFGLLGPPSDICSGDLLVFPIKGDNRLPDVVERDLLKAPIGPRVAICVLGDFVRAPAHRCAVAEEAQRILRLRRLDWDCPPLLLDTPMQADLDRPRIARWTAQTWGDAVQRIRPDELPFDPRRGVHEPALVRLLQLVPGLTFALDENGCCIAVSLAEGSIYPRSLITSAGQTYLETIWKLLDELEALAELRVPFAGLTDWPLDTPRLFRRLTKLDFRGNCLRSFSFISRCPVLRWLNLSDNGLESIPTEAFDLKDLRVLLAYKNQIRTIPVAIGRLRWLERLSLYRNRLEDLPDELASCSSLRRLNLGANPIQALPVGLAALPLRELILRNLTISHLVPVLLQFMQTARIDVAKTDLSPAALSNLRSALPQAEILS